MREITELARNYVEGKAKKLNYSDSEVVKSSKLSYVLQKSLRVRKDGLHCTASVQLVAIDKADDVVIDFTRSYQMDKATTAKTIKEALEYIRKHAGIIMTRVHGM